MEFSEAIFSVVYNNDKKCLIFFHLEKMSLVNLGLIEISELPGGLLLFFENSKQEFLKFYLTDFLSSYKVVLPFTFLQRAIWRRLKQFISWL